MRHSGGVGGAAGDARRPTRSRVISRGSVDCAVVNSHPPYKRKANLFRKGCRSSLVLVCAVVFATTACRVVRSSTAVNRAGSLYEQGKYSDALDAYREAVRIDPSWGTAHCGMANTLRMLGRSDEAIEFYKTAVRLEPDAIDCRYPLAVVLYERGEYVQAKAECEDVSRRTPTICDCQVYLGLIAARMDRRTEALGWFKKADDTEPGCTNEVVGAAEVYRRLANR